MRCEYRLPGYSSMASLRLLKLARGTTFTARRRLGGVGVRFGLFGSAVIVASSREHRLGFDEVVDGSR